MTTVSQPRAIPFGRPVRIRATRRIADALIRAVGKLRGQIRDIADSGQLGPDAEIEIGRWTGARV